MAKELKTDSTWCQCYISISNAKELLYSEYSTVSTAALISLQQFLVVIMVKSTFYCIFCCQTLVRCHDILSTLLIFRNQCQESLGACSVESARAYFCICVHFVKQMYGQQIEIEMCRERLLDSLAEQISFHYSFAMQNSSQCFARSVNKLAFGLRAEASSSRSRVIGHHLSVFVILGHWWKLSSSAQEQWCTILMWDTDFL